MNPGRITYEEFLERAGDHPHAEWVDGEVIEKAPASWSHQELCCFLAATLRTFAEMHRLGEVVSAFQMKTGNELPGREPDLLFIATARLSRVQAMHMDGPADLVVEVISRESRTRDRGEKFYEYERGGVREYWVIDAEQGKAEFYVQGTDGFFQSVASDADGVYRSEVLTGLWIQTAWLFAEPLPPIVEVLKAWNLV